MALRTSLLASTLYNTLTPAATCSRGIHKLSRLNKLCNFTGPADKDDDGWVKIIGYYGKDTTVHVGNVVKVTYKGRMYKAVITGLVRDRKDCPRFDTNNCVFINDKHEPLGTRISGPVSLKLRKYGKYNKLLSLCTEFY